MLKHKYNKNIKVWLTLLWVLLCLVWSFSCSAQTFSEFFKQKKTQKKYLVEQIAALQVYLGYAKKGYDIAGSGLATIKKLGKGEFSLHSAFFSSLSAVSTLFRDHVKVAEIIAFQLEILHAFNGLSSGAGFNVELLPDPAWSYVCLVKAKVLMECANDLETLTMVLGSGRLQLDEQARLAQLERIHRSMRDKLLFSRGFMADLIGFVNHKEIEINSIQFLNKAYGDME